MRGILSRSPRTFWLILLAAFAAPLTSYSQTPLISFTGTTFSYLSNKVDPGFGDGWTLPGFNDSSWPTGVGLFGLEAAGIYPYPFNTRIDSPSIGGAGAGPLSVYFRTHFQWSGSTVGVTLQFSNYVDDGVLVFLNGVELFSFNVPATRPLPWDTLTLPNAANPLGEGVAIVTNAVPNNLVEGDNVIAVALHQQANTTSDNVFGMAMYAIPPVIPVNLAPTQPTNRVVRQNAPTTLIVQASGSPPPTYQWFEDGVAIPGANSASLTLTNTVPGDFTKSYYCHVENVVGQFDSRTAVLSFTSDTVPPRVVRAVGSASFATVQVEYDEFMEFNGVTDYLNYHVFGPGDVELGVTGVSLNPSGTSVTLTLGNAMTEGGLHKVTFENGAITDLAFNVLADNTSVEFRSWVSQTCFGPMLEAYNGLPDPNNAGIMGGNAVNQLTSHPTFPNSPTETLRPITAFDGGEVGYGPPGGEAHEGYGARMRGIFVPPSSGLWRFALRSDDAGQLWLNPNGPGAAGRTLIAEEGGCCGSLILAVGDRRLSGPQNLQAGQPYYIETLWKEGTGGDYCQVAAVLDGLDNQVTNPIPREWLGSAMIPDSAGSFTITQQPADTTGPDGTRLSFTVGTSTDVPLCYQWMRDGGDITGAIGPKYSFVPVLADSGAKFSVRVSIPGGGTLTSREATLTVERDTVAPVVIAVVAAVGGNSVTVSFNERVDATSAQNAGNYSINGISPISATLQNNTNVVLVPASALAPCLNHQCVIRNVTDTSGNPLGENPTTIGFLTPILLVANSATHLWSLGTNGVDLGTAWREKGYDDSGWPTAPGVFASEDPATMPPGWTILTDLGSFPSFGTKPTFYFRTHFNLPTHPATITRLQLSEVVDDGSASYINGTLVNPNRLTPPFDFATLSGGAPSEAPHPVEVFSLPTSALVQGDNVLAVEVHQSSTTSSDIVYGAELVAFVSRCGVGLTITRVSDTQVRLDWPDATYGIESAPSLGGPWTLQPGLSSGSTVNSTPANRFFRLVK